MKSLRRALEQLESREVPATFVWTGLGADDNWSSAGNWQGNSGPAQASGGTVLDLVFPGVASRLSNLNNLAAGTVINSIDIQGTGYTLAESPDAPSNAIVLGTETASGGTIAVSAGIASSVITIPMTLNTTTNPSVIVGTGSVLTIAGVLSSNGGAQLNKSGTGTLVLSADNSNFHGTIALGANAGVIRAQGSPNALGSTTNGTFVGMGSQLQIDSLTAAAFEPIHLSGTGINGDGALLNIAGTNTTNGSVFLEGNASIGVQSDTLILGQVLVAAGNSSLTKVGPGTLQLNQVATLFGPTIISAGALVVNGSIANSAVNLTGGTLGGQGTTGSITTTGGTVRPGLLTTPANFRTGSVVLNGATFSPAFSLNGSGGDTSDLLNVTGTVNLTGATLTPITSGYVPTRMFALLLIGNDGTDAVMGTFNGLAEGAVVTLSGVPFTITYHGNDGNDVLLSPQSPIPTTDPFAVGGLPNGYGVSYSPPQANGTYQTLPSASFLPFGDIAASVRVATSDVNGDLIKDTILVTGPGVPIRVAVVSGVDSKLLVPPFDPFGGNFTGGGFVSAADFDGDHKAEVVVTPDRGGGPRIVIFSFSAGTLQQRTSFLGIDDDSFRGGARTAAGDIDGDTVPDLVVAAGFLGGPRMAIFNGATVFATPTRLVADFFAFETALRNGAYVAIGDMDGDGFGDLHFGAGPGGAPRLLTISGKSLIDNGAAAAIDAPLSNFFVAGNVTDRGGVRVASTDSDNDTKSDVIVGSGEGSVSRIRVYLGKNFGGGEPALFQDLDPFQSAKLADGIFVG